MQLIEQDERRAGVRRRYRRRMPRRCRCGTSAARCRWCSRTAIRRSTRALTDRRLDRLRTAGAGRVASANAQGNRARALLGTVGLAPRASRAATRTSCRAASASASTSPAALALEPRLVILDEAVSALDKSVEAQVLNLLDDLKERASTSTYIFISPRPATWCATCRDRVLVMYLGQVVEVGPVDAGLRRAHASLHAGAAVARCPVGDPDAAHQRGAALGRSAQPDQPALGLPLPHPPAPSRKRCAAGRSRTSSRPTPATVRPACAGNQPRATCRRPTSPDLAETETEGGPCLSSRSN